MSRMLIALVALCSLEAVALAQSQQPTLAEIARKESERRKTVKAPSRVYTNADVPQSGLLTTAAPAAASGPAEARPAEPPKPSEAAPEEPVKDEAWWRARVTKAREALRQSRILADALQTRVNALTTDFVNRDDPAQREVLARQRREAMTELDRVNADIETGQKAVREIEEEARRAGVPPGWLR